MTTARRVGPRPRRILVGAASVCLLGGIFSGSALASPAWLVPADLSEAGQSASESQIAISSDGEAVALWSRSDGSHTIIQATARPPGGGWQSPVDVSTIGQNAAEPQLALDAEGDATAVWRRYDGADQVVQSSTRLAAGAWRSPINLSAAGQNASEPQIGVSPAGEALALWKRYDGADTVIEAASETAGGSWHPPFGLSVPGQNASEPQIAVNTAGETVALWSRSNGTNTIIQSVAKPVGGAWGPPVDVSVIGRNAAEPQLAVDPEGNAAALWQRSSELKTLVQSAGYDAAGPQLHGLSIPTAGTARQPLSFSVSPFDVWSALGETSWTFGDGDGAAGPSVSHTFHLPGTYEVSVTGTDALGNATSRSSTVTIFPRATAARIVLVKGRRALLKLRCKSTVGCSGEASLTAGLRTESHHRRLAIRLLIGKGRFDIPHPGLKSVPLRLSAQGSLLVRQAGRSGAKAQLGGMALKHRVVLLLWRRGAP